MIRPFKPEDAEALAAVYRDAVRTVGPVAYTKEQVEMWARYPEDMEEFRTRLSRGVTLIAEEDGAVVAFGQLDPDDHLAFLYCSGSFCRRGIGTEIYRALEAFGLQKGVSGVTTDATRISRPFFAKHGYSVVEVEQVVRFGIEFERFRMLKKIAVNQSLQPTAPSDPGAA